MMARKSMENCAFSTYLRELATAGGVQDFIYLFLKSSLIDLW